MIYVIEVGTQTQLLIAGLNDGVVPEIEESRTYFVYYTNSSAASKIVTRDQLDWMPQSAFVPVDTQSIEILNLT